MQERNKGEKSRGICHVTLPLSDEAVQSLRSGDYVLLSGEMYTARDAAHSRMDEAIKNSAPLPFSIEGQTIYYMGPSPAGEGQIIGSAGPTTAGRMDKYTPALLKMGLRGMVGKGRRSAEVRLAMQENPSVYFAAVGGAGALLSKCITSVEEVAYGDLGTEAIRKLTVKDFPVVVVMDMWGNDLYAQVDEGVCSSLQNNETEE